MSSGPTDDLRPEGLDPLVVVASAMRDMFGDRALAVVERQIALADPARPVIAARWRAIASILRADQA